MAYDTVDFETNRYTAYGGAQSSFPSTSSRCHMVIRGLAGFEQFPTAEPVTFMCS
jgi:hypothetical protein